MSTKGIVFDIQRCSLHDGPGIRTTVFLKGCLLKCLWCHNPESWCKAPELLYREDRCANCMMCTKVCPTGAHCIKEEKHIFERERCNACGKCIKVCAHSALRLLGKSMDADEIMDEVVKDMSYFSASGGGMTISGGEPTIQYDFLLELLKKAKEKGIHTCIETSGMAAKDKFISIAKHVDLFLYDIKELDNEKHFKFTGINNDLILSNLGKLYTLGSEIILRCPIIPGFNDSETDIKSLAELVKKYPRIKAIEILPYHDFGKIKWKELGKEEPLGNVKKFQEYEIEAILKQFKERGCEKIVLG